jgi:hypothetical protein
LISLARTKEKKAAVITPLTEVKLSSLMVYPVQLSTSNGVV